MTTLARNTIIFGAFALVAGCGLAISFSAPHLTNDDELVYLAGAQEASAHNLPDAVMLHSFDQGPYLYPKVLLREYPALGNDLFKSIYLVGLIFATGLAAYAMFLMLGLSWVPSLLFSIVALMPRISTGIEVFGVFTFKEAVGRASALPVFFLATGFLIKRLIERKSLWPVFGILGFVMFLHPVSVMLFAFVALIAIFVTELFRRTPFFRALCDLIVNGVTFVLAGSYFFVEVFTRLFESTSSAGVSALEYTDAATSRNPWEFPPVSLQWAPHIVAISLFFILFILAVYTLPMFRALRARVGAFPNARAITVWGSALALGSLVVAILFPGLNLYAMKHLGAPYLFQQWSRIGKFFYLGLFVALIPIIGVLWEGYRAQPTGRKTLVVVLLFLVGVGSSSFGLEVAEFVAGYKNYDTAYIPQALSHAPDEVGATDYQALCATLTALGATSHTLLISNDFGLRYYCKAHLYTTFEEGAAFFQRPRAELIDWNVRYNAQHDALITNDPKKIDAFARSVGAAFVIVSNTTQHAMLLAGATSTPRFIIMTVPKRP